MWITNTNDNSVTKITPLGVMTSYAGTGTMPFGIAFDGSNMWTVNREMFSNGGSVTRITPTGEMTTFPGGGGTGIAFDGTNMWTANNNWPGRVTKISTK